MKRIFTLVLALMMLLVPQAVRCQEELTIYENGTATSTYVPVHGLWADAYLKCEFVIPADQLEEMDGGTISQMIFYLASSASGAWTGTFQVFLKEVDNTTISAYYGPDNATVVYEGSLDASQSTMVVAFNETYTYGGGNLLVGVYQIVKSSYKSATFAGENVSGASVQGYSSSSLDAVTVNQRNFIPKTTFLYTPGGDGPVCEKPTNITTSNITPNSATVSWTGEGSAFNLRYKASTATDWTEVNGLSDLSYNLTGLVSNTTYSVRVQQVCTEGTSGWKTATFATPLGIPLVETFDASSVPTDWTMYTGLLSNVLNGTALTSATSGWIFGENNGVFDSHARVNIYSTGCQRWLVTPFLLMEDNVELSFDMALTAYSGTLGTPQTDGADDKFVVLITADGGSTWEILRQWDNAGSEYVYNNIPCSVDGENVSIDLSSYAGQNIAIAFYGESTASNADNNFHIDNVRIDYGDVVSCKKPTGFVVTDVATHSTTLTWNENGSSSVWQICLNNDTTNLLTADSNPFTLTSLTPETAYTVKVRASCGNDGVSSWSTVVTFTTASCPAPVTIDTAVCASELPLTWHGHTFEEYGSFTENLTAADGCDSIVTWQVRNLLSYSSLLSDDFNDGAIDPEKWTYTGNTVVEEDGQLKLYQNVTDQDVHLQSVDLNVPANGTVMMDRKFRVHRSDNSSYGNYFYGNSRFYLNGGSDYVGLQYNYTTYEGWYGTYLIYDVNGNEGRVRICDAIFDTWLTEQVEIDFFAGTLSYYLDTLVATVNIPGLSAQTVDYVNVFFNPGGWWTGHQHFLDYVEIHGGIGVVRTAPASDVAYTSATSGGEVSPNECDAYTATGVCWSTIHNPTLDDAHTTDGTGAGTFTSELTNLTEGTTYYVRAYAVNSTDTVYGQEVNFTTCKHFSTEFEDAICENALPYVWNEIPYDEDGEYTQTLQTAAGCDSVVTLHLTVLSEPTVTITGPSFVDPGKSITLTASGADIYAWSANGAIISNNDSITVYPQETTTFSVTGYMERRNLVVNSDFEQGNTGFTTNYSYVNDGSWGHYYIGHDNHEMWSWDPATNVITDHTTGNGLWMMVDAYPNRNIWSQTVEVTPNTDYAFSAWFVTNNIANVRFEINGQQGEIFTTPQQQGVWEKRQFVWNSGNNTSANLKITTGSASSSGNDFGIDDISFSALTCETTASVTVGICPDPVTIDTTICPSELPLTWHGHTFEEYGIFSDTLTAADGCDSVVKLMVKTPFSLLSDDFNDGVIDPSKWTYTGNAVVEEDGLLKMQQNVTDQDVHLRSVSMDVPYDGKVDIARRFMVHRDERYYYGSNYIYFNGDNNSYIQLQYTYAEYYDNAYHHSDPMNGIYVYSRVGGVESNVRICDIEFDTWLTEHVELDFTAGTMSYYMDTLVAIVDIPGLSSQTVDSFCVQYHPYGWWTGHQHFMDYVEIHGGMGTVRTAPVSEVAYTTATCGGDVAPNECVEYTVTGVCWSTSQNPTLNDAHTTDGTGVGMFTSEITGLEEGTTYYVRAYALGGTDTVYGQMVSFTTCRHFTSEFEATICENALPYVWNEVSYNASGDYTQTFLTAANCDSMVTLHLTVLPPPVIEIARADGHSATVCEGAATAIEAVVTGGYGEVTSYLWWENGNLLPGETNAVLNIDNLAPNANDIYTVEVAQEGAGCYNSAAATLDTLVTVYPQFTVSVSAPATVCDNGTLTLTATMNNASDEDELTYQWYGVPTSGTNAAIYTTDNLQAGSHDCFVAVTGNVSGCYAESDPVHVEILPTYHTTLYDTICQGYEYDFFGEPLTESGPYTHTLQANNECDSVITLHLTVLPKPSVEIARAAGYAATVCEGTATAIEAVVTGGYGEIVSYQWYKNGNVLPNETNIVLNIENLTVGADDLYTFEVAQTGDGCSNTASVALNTLVTVYPQFTVSVSGPASICDNGTLTLTATVDNASDNDVLTYQWYQITDGVANAIEGANAATYTSTNMQNGSYDYQLEVHGSVSGCNAVSDPFHVNVLLNPTVTITGPTNVDLGQSVTLTADGAESYEWSANDANIGDDASVTVSPEAATIYSVIGTDQNGCTGTASEEVTVNLPPVVTTATVSDITAFTATCGGNVTADGGAEVTGRGVCWSTAHNPTTADAHTADGAGTGEFTSVLTELTRGTTYYVRAYATNRIGTAYGEEVAFTTAFCPSPVIFDTAVCASDLPLTWHGHTFEEAESYSATYQTAVGCDSMVTLNLTVIPSISGTFTALIPENDSLITNYPVRFTWNAVENTSGYDLYVWPVEESQPQEPTASQVHGTHYTISELPNNTDYQWFVKTYNACDTVTSTIHQFSLNVTPVLTVSSGNPVDFGEIPFNSTRSVYFQVNGTALDAPINYQLTGADASSFSLAPANTWDDLHGGRMQLTFYPTVPQSDYTAQMTIQSGNLVETVTVMGALSDFYTFTTYVDDEVYAMDGDIPIHGQVINLLNESVAGLNVEVVVKVMDYVRTLPATSDANGQFTVMFTPQHSEAGYYTVGSRKAGHSSQPEHDAFNIPGMMLTSSDWILWNPTLDNADTGTIAVRNRSQLPLTNIQVTPMSLPNGCTVQFLPLNLAGMATGELQYIVSGSVTSTGVNYEEVPLHAVSDEGASMDFSAWYYCIPQRADLDVLPTSLVTTMTRGKSKVVDFMIYNNGTGSTGNIYVSLPNVPWMSVVGSDTLPSLAAHDSAYVSIRLLADSTTDLVRYTGNFAIHCERGEGVSIPYDITAISDSTGTLVVDVTDEYAWNTNNGHGPHLAGASVTVKGYYSLETVATGVTNDNGLFVADDLPEGWYKLIIRANRHAEYQNNLYITAGDTNLQDIFIPFQAITYSWDVVPTEIEDVYTYELNVDFETHVPKPVVTMDIDRTLSLLGDCEMGEFNVLATNHGLVAAMDVSVVVPQSDYFVFTPLVSHIDSLPALTTYTIPVTYQRKDCTELGHLMSMSAVPTKAKAPDYYDGITCAKEMFNLTYWYFCRITHWETVISGDLKYDKIQEICGGDTSRPTVNVSRPTSGPGPDISNITDIAINPDWVRNYPYINLPNLTGYEPGITYDTNWTIPEVLKFCDPNLTPCQNAINGVLECVPVVDFKVGATEEIQLEIGETTLKITLSMIKGAFEMMGLKIISDLISVYEHGGCVSEGIISNIPNIVTCLQSWSNPYTASEIKERDLNTILSVFRILLPIDYIETDMKPYLYRVLLSEMPNAMAQEGSVSVSNSPQPSVLSKNKGPIYEGQITAAGRAHIMAACLEINNSPEVEEIVNMYIDRWNHSIEAWNNGYFTAADAPTGYDTNFIQIDTNLVREFYELNAEAMSQGYANLFERYNESIDALQESLDEYQENQHSSSLCATVTVQFSQKMTMTREAFEGTLTINNGNESNPIQDIDVDFVIRDENGVDCTNLFQINFLSYNNMTGTNGSLVLDAENEGSIIVQFIPTKQAAPEIAKVYSFGGTLSFIDPFTGEYMNNNLYPVDIWVHPSPDLYVNYFMQRDILGDDPLTEENVEPIVPAELGVIIHNRGAGIAKNVILETAEPRIIDNEKGLAINFAMYGAAFNGNERQLGLMAIPFGNIEPNRTGVGEWWFTSTLLGHFVSYEAHVIHNSSFGNPDLSLVSSLRIHPLIHTVYAYGNLDDGINDFLVDDVDDYRQYPDSLYFSNGSRTAVAIADSIGFDHYVTPLDTIVQLTLDPSRIGWNYEQTWDPGRGQYKLISCTRNSDQQVIPLSNIWQSFVTLPVGGDPVYEDRLHIVDTLNTDQPTTYTLVFSLHDLVLEVDTIMNVPDSIITAPLSEVTVKFNKPIVDSTFSNLDMSLKCNNGENLLDENLNVERIDSMTYKLHLEPYTHQSGYYVLDIQTLEITDANGFNGYYAKRATWTQNINTCQPDSVSISVTECDSYTWAGVTYHESGDIIRKFYNTAGCDSVVTLHLTINYSNEGDTIAVVCNQFDWYEHTGLTESGEYTHTFTNAAGCDSVVTLHLTVNHSNEGDTIAVVCNQFDWYEHTGLTESGEYTHTFMNAAGCDSVVTLHLTVTPCDPDAVVVTIVGHTGTNGYDASEHSVSGFDVTAIEIGGEATTLYTEADFSLAEGVTATASRTDAGQTNMGLTAESFVNNNTDFETVVFLVTDGWQRIGKRSVTISLDSNKVYDGEVFTVNADQLHVTGLLEGQTLTGQLWTEEADPGVYENHNGFFQATLEAGVIYSSLAVQSATSSNVTSNYTPAFDVTLIIEDAPQPCAGVTYQGHDYEAVQIGSQCWFTEDLRVPVGDHHYYKDDPAYFEKFGYLYSWYTAVGVDEGDIDTLPPTLTADDGTPYVQGICPAGWAVPSMADIAELDHVVGTTSLLKDPSTDYWLPGFEGATDGTGFNARGCGWYNASQERYEDLKTGYHFWAADAQPGTITIYSACTAYYCDTIILTDPNQKNDRKSVRCIRKVEP